MSVASAKSNDSVNRMLALVRDALGCDESPAAVPTPPQIPESITRLVPVDAPLIERFIASAINAKLHVEKVPASQLSAGISEFLASKNCRKIGIADTEYLAEMKLSGALSQNGLEIHNWANLTLDASYDLDAGITEVYAAIAETGSLVVRPETRCGRALSLVPPIHIAIVRPENILPDLFDLFAKLSTEPRLPNTTLITGPSKTADIEGALVVGVHGPGYVQVYLVQK